LISEPASTGISSSSSAVRIAQDAALGLAAQGRAG
jgi:hypothetical protein